MELLLLPCHKYYYSKEPWDVNLNSGRITMPSRGLIVIDLNPQVRHGHNQLTIIMRLMFTLQKTTHTNGTAKQSPQAGCQKKKIVLLGMQ